MKFKKIIIGLLIANMMFGAVACTNTEKDPTTQGEVQNKELEGTLEEIMAKVYKGLGNQELPKIANTPLDNENVEYYLGLTDLNGNEGLASEAVIGSIAHSVVLLRAKEGSDIEALKAEIKEKVNPRKWICVGVERDEVIVDNIGNTIIMIIDQNIAKDIHDSFKALAK